MLSPWRCWGLQWVFLLEINEIRPLKHEDQRSATKCAGLHDLSWRFVPVLLIRSHFTSKHSRHSNISIYFNIYIYILYIYIYLFIFSVYIYIYIIYFNYLVDAVDIPRYCRISHDIMTLSITWSVWRHLEHNFADLEHSAPQSPQVHLSDLEQRMEKNGKSQCFTVCFSD